MAEDKIDSKNAGILRKAYTDMRDSMCANADLLTEPFKSQFLAMKKNFDDAIAGLPATDAVPAAMDANYVLNGLHSLLASSSSLCSFMSQQCAVMVKNHATALASAADVEITRRITAGELFTKEAVETKLKDYVPKTDATSLCTAAKEAGINEGLAKARQEFDALQAQKTVIETRKASLASAGVALPLKEIDKLLGGPDAEFNARVSAAKARRTELESAGVAYDAANPIWGRVWEEGADYDSFKTISTAAFGAANQRDPFAGGTDDAGKPAFRMIA